MSRPDLTEIAFILDRSGSMQSLTEAAISGFNRFLREQQQEEGEARLTLMLFDDEFLVPADSIPVREVVELDTTTYVARGSTALLDAIGRTVKRVRERLDPLPEAQRPGKVVFAIYTDGFENSSVEFTWHDIAKLIRERRETAGWEFLFMAANQDAIATAAQMNIMAKDTASVDYSAKGMHTSTSSISRRVSSYRKTSRGQHDADAGKTLSDIVEEEDKKDPPEA